MNVFLISISVYLQFVSIVNAIPVHASCKITWSFGAPCNSVSEKVVLQIKKWNGPDNCTGGGEKCLYSLVSETQGQIKAIHETPVKYYRDDLTFTLADIGSSSCQVKGYSTSETWYAVLDYGTNYCNLQNLITGAGLDNLPGYKKAVSDSQCTQYSSSNCDKY